MEGERGEAGSSAQMHRAGVNKVMSRRNDPAQTTHKQTDNSMTKYVRSWAVACLLGSLPWNLQKQCLQLSGKGRPPDSVRVGVRA